MFKIRVFIVIISVFVFFSIRCTSIVSKADNIDISVLRSPKNILIKGDSARYIGRSQYQILATVTNNTDKGLVYMPIFAIIRNVEGKKIGLAMGNTGRLVEPGKSTLVSLDTVIPKESGTPCKVELYSE